MIALVDTGIFSAFYSLRDRHRLDPLGLIVHIVEGVSGRAFIANHVLNIAAVSLNTLRQVGI